MGKKKKKKRWLQALEYWLARGALTLLQALPVGFAYRIGRMLGWVLWRLLKRRRQAVHENLEVVNAWLARQGVALKSPVAGMSLDEQVRELFMRNCASLLGGFALFGMSAEDMERHLEVRGMEQARAVLESGKGAILLLAHMGPWEALNHIQGVAREHAVDAPLGVMFRPLNNQRLDDWYKQQRGALGTQLFSRATGFHKPVDFLRSGGILGILADQKMRQGEKVPFFGVEVSTSPIPGLFHRRSGAPMIYLSMETIGKAKWRITIDRVDLTVLDGDTSREAFARLCNAYLEKALAVSPLDGFWFSKRFR